MRARDAAGSALALTRNHRPAALAQQRIGGFERDAAGHWAARLECGHRRQLRHAPPWISRPWVLSAEGRCSMLGTPLNCAECGPGARGPLPD